MEERYEQMFNSLMKALIQRPQTLISVFMFHLAIMTFSTGNIGFVLVFSFVAVFVQKMSRFHSFMIKHGEDSFEQNIQRDALIMSCLSLFLEVFGHVFISLPSGVGYFMYTMESQYIIIVLLLSISADFGRSQIGMRFGTHSFARHVAPKMRLEGAILSILTPMILSYLMAQSGYFLNITSQDFMWLGHMTGFLSLMGYLMIAFFKRCAHISQSVFLKTKLSKEELI